MAWPMGSQNLALEFGVTDIVTEKGDERGEDQGPHRRAGRAGTSFIRRI
jgi:hypothetical protein